MFIHFNYQVNTIQQRQQSHEFISINSYYSTKVILCTPLLTKQLYPSLKLKIVREQVGITSSCYDFLPYPLLINYGYEGNDLYA